MNVMLRAESDRVDAQLLGPILANSQAIALAVVRRGRIAFANPAFATQFDAAGSLIGVALEDMASDIDRDRLRDALAAAEHRPVQYTGAGMRASGASFELELQLEGAVLAGERVLLARAADVTERHRSVERLGYLAYSDALTGLANRALFTDRLRQAMLAARREGGGFAVLVADLDAFKAVNDTHGHAVGDAVLRLVAKRFHGCLRETDTLARLGGDEFAVLLPQLADRHAAAAIAERMIAALLAPLELGAHRLVIGASIGIAACPEHASSPDPLLVAADTALYQAKRAGKNRWQWAIGQFATDAAAATPPTWSAAHAVGVRQIDDQHAHMAGLIDALSAALKDGADHDSVIADLNRLIAYAEFHFATEERIMAEFALACLPAHRAVHRRLLDDVSGLGREPDLAAVSLILRYLQEWLLRHVDGLDRDMGRQLAAKGCH